MATTDNWIGTASADWGTSAANWSTGFPTSNSNVHINTTNILTIGFGSGDNYIINSLTVGNDFFDMSGGNLTILGAASFADSFTQTGGTLSAGGAVTISGTGTLTGGAAEGKTTFTINGTIFLANYTLGGSTVLNNVKTTNETGQISLGDDTGVDATINNEKGATFAIAGDFGITQGAATARFINAAGATLEKTGGDNTSLVAVNLTDTGAIVAATGALEFSGPDNSFAGAISGAGQFELGGGSNDLIAADATIASATFGITDVGTLVTLGENLSYAGAFNLENSATLDLAGFTLTLSGTDTFSNAPTIDGTATLVTVSGSTTGVNSFTLGGTVDWRNSGTVSESALLTIGDGSANAATLTNETGGVYEFTTDNGIARGAASSSRFINLAGATLEKTGGSGDSLISVDVTDSGAITVSSGTIEFEGPDSTVAGAVSGAGQFALGGGSIDLIAAGATIASATFGIIDPGTLVALGENLSYAGAFNLENSATLDLAGFTLTLSGTDTFSNFSTIDGTGTLVTVTGSTTGVNSFTLGGTVDWRNSGTVSETALTIGDVSFNTATFTNEKGGVYEFTTDNGIARGAALNSSFVNLAGATLEKTGGSGDSIVSVDVTDSGAITVSSGTIEFEGPDSTVAGAVSGAGQFVLGFGSSDLIAAGATIGSATFGITDSGTLVALGENLSYAGAFNLENSATLDLAGFTLTLSGTDTFSNAPTIDGAGSLVTASRSTIGVNLFTLGGEVNWQNSGTIDELNILTIGDVSFNTATFTNEKGGVYEFTTDNGIARGAALNSSFVNLAGATLEKTGGSGDSIVSVDVTDTGAITVNTTGIIEFEGMNNSFAGAISGIGQFVLGFGSSDLVAAGATIGSATFGITDSGTLVALGENLSYAGAFNLENSATLDLAGFTLTVSGTDTFSGFPTIDGIGTLVTAHGGTASVNAMTLGGEVDWQNSGTVDELGLPLTIGDASYDVATFTNEKGGVYDFVTDDGIVIGAISTSSFVNLAGATLEKTAGTGDSAIAVAFTNDGKVLVDSGRIEFQSTVNGTGTFTLNSGTVLQFDTSVASGSSVDFASTTGGELVLFDSQQFGAAVHGFGGTKTDEMDLRDIDFGGVAFKLGYSGNTTQGVLTVTDGTHTAHLTMFGNYTSANFHASGDGAGGTAIVDPATHPTLLAFAR